MKSSGVMLIELMIALTISFMVLVALLEMYLSNQRSYKLQTALSDIQYNAKSAIAFLAADIQAAGRIGCARLSADFPLASATSYTLSPKNKIMVKNANLQVRHADQVTGRLKDEMRQANKLPVETREYYQAGDILIISDCSKAEIFKIEHVSLSHGLKIIITSAPLHDLYDQHAEVARFLINEYSVEKTKQKNSDGSPRYALFKLDIKHQKIRIANNLSNLGMHFTVYSDGEWVDLRADDVDDWAKVVGVAIEFDVQAASIKKHWHSYVALQEAVE